MARGIQVKLELDKETRAHFNRVLKLLGDDDAHYIQAAMQDVSEHLAQEAMSRAPASFRPTVHAQPVTMMPTRSGRRSVAARGIVSHPGAKSREFGRHYWYSGYRRGSRQKGSRRERHDPGQLAKPFIGIMGRDQAIAATLPYVHTRIAQALQQVWQQWRAA